MFKKGQVWRNNLSGSLYRVLGVHSDSFGVVEVLTGPAAGKVGNLIETTARGCLTLVGNNYQERPTKQAQPGAAFSRWLDEQRGCRKEDC